MNKTEIRAKLKEKLGVSNRDGKPNFRLSKDVGYFGEVAIGSSSPMDVTSAGADRRMENKHSILQVLHDLGLKELVILSETDRWTYAGKKGCESYDRGYRTYYIRFAWREIK